MLVSFGAANPGQRSLDRLADRDDMGDERLQTLADVDGDQCLKSANTAGAEPVARLRLVVTLLAAGQNGFHIRHLQTLVLLGEGDGRLDLVWSCRAQVVQHGGSDREIDQIVTKLAEIAEHRHIIAGAAR